MILPLLVALAFNARAANPAADDALGIVERELVAGMAADIFAGKPPVPNLERLKTAVKLELRGSTEALCKWGACRRYPLEDDFNKLAVELAPKVADVASAAGGPLTWDCEFERKLDALLDGAPSALGDRLPLAPNQRAGAVAPRPGGDEEYYMNYPPGAALALWRDLPRPALARRDEAAAYFVLQTLRAPLIARNADGGKPKVDELIAATAVKLFSRLRGERLKGRHYPGEDDFAHYGKSAARRIVGMAASVRRGKWDCAQDEKLLHLVENAVERLAKSMPKGSGEIPPAAPDELAYYR